MHACALARANASRVKTKLTVLVTLLSVGAIGLAAAPAGAMTVGPFCPASGTITIPGSDGRCVNGWRWNVLLIDAYNRTTPVMKCAVLKPNSDGSGGNVGGAVSCMPGTQTARVEYIVNGYHGHATIINQGSTHSGFYGLLGLA
jgi:hypothetical protein